MLNIAICDDEDIYRQDLKRIITTELELKGFDYHIGLFRDGESLVADDRMPNYQIIFLDIEMKELDGIDSAKRIRTKNPHAMIIFVTSHPDFVFQGYDVRALNYILKPYSSQRIKEILDDAVNQLKLTKVNFYSITYKGKTTRLDLDEVKYFLSDKHTITVVTTDDNYIFYGKLDELEGELPGYFTRIHSRYLVNVKYIEELNTKKVKIGNDYLPVSRACKENAAVAYAKYLLK